METNEFSGTETLYSKRMRCAVSSVDHHSPRKCHSAELTEMSVPSILQVYTGAAAAGAAGAAAG